MKRPRLPIPAAALLALLGACDRADLAGPPELRLGRDECGECGMLIAEDRCAAAVLAEVAGRHEHILYDDIGCMLAHESVKNPDTRILGRFVRDYGFRAWVSADLAVFVVADPGRVQTPMGSGIVAYEDGAAARAKALELQAETATYAELSRRFQQASAPR